MKNGARQETCSISFDKALFSVAGIIADTDNPSGINDAAIYSYPEAPNNITVSLDVFSHEETYSTVKSNWFLICK